MMLVFQARRRWVVATYSSSVSYLIMADIVKENTYDVEALEDDEDEESLMKLKFLGLFDLSFITLNDALFESVFLTFSFSLFVLTLYKMYWKFFFLFYKQYVNQLKMYYITLFRRQQEALATLHAATSECVAVRTAFQLRYTALAYIVSVEPLLYQLNKESQALETAYTLALEDFCYDQ